MRRGRKTSRARPGDGEQLARQHARIEFDPARLFDVDRPTGPVIHTEPDHPARAEIRFRRALRIDRLLAFGSHPTPTADRHAASAYRHGRDGGHDGCTTGARSCSRGDVTPKRPRRRPGVTPGEAGALLDALDLVVRGRYERAHRVVISRVADEADRRLFGAAVNRTLLPARGPGVDRPRREATVPLLDRAGADRLRRRLRARRGGPSIADAERLLQGFGVARSWRLSGTGR